MKNIGVVTNTEKDPGLSYTMDTILWLVEKGCRPFLTQRLGDELNMRQYACEARELFEQTDFLAILGGDGTILSVARDAAVYEKPLLGINLGTLGYLTDVEKTDGFDALEKVLHGNYKLEKRMMLDVGTDFGDNSHKEANNGEQAMAALNDICVTKSVLSKMITIELYINDEYIDTFRADGIIIATPTGSTAYNLSAGGPILKPDGEMIAITPICPHSLHIRPWIISANDLIKLRITDQSRRGIPDLDAASESVLVLDGQNRLPIKNGETITIYRSELYTRTIRTNDQGFYDILRRKLGRMGEQCGRFSRTTSLGKIIEVPRES